MMLHYFFDWYQGGVWGNLIASLIWAIPAYLWGRTHAKKNHRKNEAIHKDIAKIHEHLGIMNEEKE